MKHWHMEQIDKIQLFAVKEFRLGFTNSLRAFEFKEWEDGISYSNDKFWGIKLSPIPRNGR